MAAVTLSLVSCKRCGDESCTNLERPHLARRRIVRTAERRPTNTCDSTVDVRHGGRAGHAMRRVGAATFLIAKDEYIAIYKGLLRRSGARSCRR